MPKLAIHTSETAPEASVPLLASVKSRFGVLPNIYGAFASSPQLLEAYSALDDLLSGTPFTPAEHQALMLAISFENSCSYCLGAHTGAARMAGLSADDLAALRSGNDVSDPKLQALVRFTREMVRQRGFVSSAAVEALLDAGWDDRTQLDVVLAIAIKTISNYTNHLADTPLDEMFEKDFWANSNR